MRRRIFVNVCSYRDPLLINTVRSLFDNCSREHNIVIGVFEQTSLEESMAGMHKEYLDEWECSEREHHQNVQYGIIYKRIDPEYSDGVGWARGINQVSMDTDHYEFMYQVDSHMLFDKNWDKTLLDSYNAAVEIKGDEKVIITNVCKVFHFEDGMLHMYPTEPTGGEIKFRHEFQECGFPSATGLFAPGYTGLTREACHLFAGNSFFPVSWVREVGNDINMFFDAEEHKLFLNSVLHGYRIYMSKELFSYHYRDTIEYVTKQWWNPITTTHRYARNVDRSHTKFTNFVNSLPVEFLNTFADHYGLDYVNKKVLDKAKL